MSTLQKLASDLADDVLAAMDELGDERYYTEVAKVIGASSQSLEEAFLTEIRIRLSERTARAFLNRSLAAARSTDPA